MAHSTHADHADHDHGHHGPPKGFIQRWVHAWLFYDVPGWVFTPIYAAFGAVVAFTWWRYPPRRSKA